MKTLMIMAILCLSLSGCAHGSAWMQGMSKDSIVVGYQGFKDPAEAKAAREKIVAENCAQYEWQKVETKSQQYVDSTPNFTTGQNYISAGTNEWWEATYTCSLRKPASQ